MKNKTLLIFILVALLQLAVPLKMIYDKESVISAGTEYKFRTAPVDPYDPFRGKYITLSFDANNFDVNNDTLWHQDDNIYVLLGVDSAGFAKIVNVMKQEPLNDQPDYVRARVQYAYDNKVTLEYNFNKFYMEESKAQKAEDAYRKANISRNNDSLPQTYALVSVKKGDAVIKDVIVNGKSVVELANEQE
ncbi:MAG: GDYXXLXY domain-containing protein [Bacteroidia bacterium]